jgi:hypothetical protein
MCGVASTSLSPFFFEIQSHLVATKKALFRCWSLGQSLLASNYAFFRAALVMEWSRKSYTRSHWLPGTKYGTNRAHGHPLHLE